MLVYKPFLYKRTSLCLIFILWWLLCSFTVLSFLCLRLSSQWNACFISIFYCDSHISPFPCQTFLAINCHFISFRGSLTPKLVDIEVCSLNFWYWSLFLMCDYFHICVGVYLLICMCSMCMQCSKGPAEGVGTPGAEVQAFVSFQVCTGNPALVIDKGSYCWAIYT